MGDLGFSSKLIILFLKSNSTTPNLEASFTLIAKIVAPLISFEWKELDKSPPPEIILSPNIKVTFSSPKKGFDSEKTSGIPFALSWIA